MGDKGSGHLLLFLRRIRRSHSTLQDRHLVLGRDVFSLNDRFFDLENYFYLLYVRVMYTIYAT